MTIDRAEYGNHEGYGLKPAKENMAFPADAAFDCSKCSASHLYY